MNQQKTEKKSWLFRILGWPLSYLLGLIIGAIVVASESRIVEYFKPTGVALFQMSWVFLIGSTFASNMIKFIERRPQTIIQKWVLRSSIAIGFTLNTIALFFFTTRT